MSRRSLWFALLQRREDGASSPVVSRDGGRSAGSALLTGRWRVDHDHEPALHSQAARSESGPYYEVTE